MMNNFADHDARATADLDGDTPARPDAPVAIYFRRWRRWITPDDASRIVGALTSHDDDGA